MTLHPLVITLSGYVLAVAGFGFALVQHFLRVKADCRLQELRQEFDTNESMKERRYKVYVEYLSKIDELNARLMKTMSGELIQDQAVIMFNEIMNNPSDLSPISRYMQRLSELTAMWAAERTKALEELNALRLVCSEPIKNLLDRYVDLTKKLLESLSDLLSKIDLSTAQIHNPKTADVVNDIYEELRQVTKEIEHQMRVDIGANR